MCKDDTFESALAELESILKKLESGSQDLNTMLELFERGLELTNICREKLKDAEDRVTTLVKDGVQLKEKSGIVST
tara:strand:+ start:471 stop:698 length:228 start_codon:yes stop_codon:yes gene_type:complete